MIRITPIAGGWLETPSELTKSSISVTHPAQTGMNYVSYVLNHNFGKKADWVTVTHASGRIHHDYMVWGIGGQRNNPQAYGSLLRLSKENSVTVRLYTIGGSSVNLNLNAYKVDAAED
jgi:hypothetical protein